MAKIVAGRSVCNSQQKSDVEHQELNILTKILTRKYDYWFNILKNFKLSDNTMCISQRKRESHGFFLKAIKSHMKL